MGALSSVEREQSARTFAVAAHGEQRYGELPYAVHLDAVHAIVSEVSGSENVRVAAYLHDVLEDTHTPAEAIEAAFGKEILELVLAVTKVPRSAGLESEARIRSTFSKVFNGGDEAVLLKLADRLANVKAAVGTSERLLQKYRGEHPILRELLYIPGKHETLWKQIGEALGS